jgi:hypothetical protein
MTRSLTMMVRESNCKRNKVCVLKKSEVQYLMQSATVSQQSIKHPQKRKKREREREREREEKKQVPFGASQ